MFPQLRNFYYQRSMFNLPNERQQDLYIDNTPIFLRPYSDDLIKMLLTDLPKHHSKVRILLSAQMPRRDMAHLIIQMSCQKKMNFLSMYRREKDDELTQFNGLETVSYDVKYLKNPNNKPFFEIDQSLPAPTFYELLDDRFFTKKNGGAQLDLTKVFGKNYDHIKNRVIYLGDAETVANPRPSLVEYRQNYTEPEILKPNSQDLKHFAESIEIYQNVKRLVKIAKQNYF